MKRHWLIILLFSSLAVNAQFYYKDIIGTNETNHQWKTYLTNKVLSVAVMSVDAEGKAASEFGVQQFVNADNKLLTTSTTSGITGQSTLFSTFDKDGRLQQTADSSGSTVNVTRYEYDQKGWLHSLKSFSGDTSKKSTEGEEHVWTYNSQGMPVQMLRIVNNTDTTQIKFLLDEQGNISQENVYKHGKTGDPVYYYYNEKKQLTDIVRFNYKLKKLLPDYMFEYADNGQMIQKITVPSNKAADYLIWRYQFDTRGLKVKEALYNKDKQLMAKIDYNYQLSQ